MPLYEYRCDKCSRKFEELIQSEKDEFNIICPNPTCDSKSFTKLMSAPNFFSGHSAITACPDNKCAGCQESPVEIKQIPATIHHANGRNEEALVHQITFNDHESKTKKSKSN